MAVADILDRPLLYRLWQAPFVSQKLAPVLSSGILNRVDSVLDVGCGPATNTGRFRHVSRYLGVDLNPAYVAFGRRWYRREFVVRDVTQGAWEGESFDLVLLNSLIHHLDDAGARNLLASLSPMVAPAGEIHVLDLVMADEGLPRRLAEADRGKYARGPLEWLDLVNSCLHVRTTNTFHLTAGPLKLWEMIHIVAEPQVRHG